LLLFDNAFSSYMPNKLLQVVAKGLLFNIVTIKKLSKLLVFSEPVTNSNFQH